MNTISKEAYNHLMEGKENKTYANYICNVKCKLGELKKFKVKDTDIIIELKCSQIGGMFSGTHCFVLPN